MHVHTAHTTPIGHDRFCGTSMSPYVKRNNKTRKKEKKK